MLSTAVPSGEPEEAWSDRLPRATARTFVRQWKLLTRLLLGELVEPLSLS